MLLLLHAVHTGCLITLYSQDEASEKVRLARLRVRQAVGRVTAVLRRHGAEVVEHGGRMCVALPQGERVFGWEWGAVGRSAVIPAAVVEGLPAFEPAATTAATAATTTAPFCCRVWLVGW